MSEIQNERRFMLTFGAPASVQELFAKANAACVMQLNHRLKPGNGGLHVTVKQPFDLTGEGERRLLLRLDQLVRGGRLKALTARLGSIGRLREPEDIVYLEVGGHDLRAAVEYLLSDIDSLGATRSELDGRTHVTLSKRTDSVTGEDLQDLAFGLCSDVLCACRKDLANEVKLSELMLYDRLADDVTRAWRLH